MSKVQNNTKKQFNWFLYTTSIIAAFLLIIANSAVWANNQIFNEQNFSNTVTDSITSESSRNAIAGEITNQIFTDRPLANRIAGNFTTNTISGLLNTDQFSDLLTPAINKLQVYATSNDQENVVVNLRGIKDVVAKVVSISDNLGGDVSVDTENVPDEIIIINSDSIPNIYRVGTVLLWLAPIAFILSIILFVIQYRRTKSNKNYILFTQGAFITFAGLIGLLVGPLFKPMLLSNVKVANNRVVVGNLYDAFINTYNQQTMLVLLIGIFAMLISAVWYLYPSIKSLIKK